MKVWSYLALILLLGFSLSSFAQEKEAAAPETAIEVQTAPAHLGNEAPGAALETDVERGNVLVVGVTGGGAYDNRGLYHNVIAPATPYYSGDTRWFVQPSVGLQRSFTTGDWTLSYTPGASFDQYDPGQTQYTHNLAGDINLKPNAYWLIHARQDFSLTDNPFETVGRVDLLPGLGGPFGPNYNGVLPQTKRTSIVSDADITYRLAEHTAIGVTGEYQKFDYDAIDTGTTVLQFTNSHVYSGSAFLSKQFSETTTAGVQVAWVDVYSTGYQVSRTQAPAAMLFFKITPNKHLIFTLYGGPQYARTRGVTSGGVAYERAWYPNVGGTMAWSSGRNAVEVQALHRIANGGGLMDAVQATFAAAGYRARLNEHLLVSTSVNFSDQKGLGALSDSQSFRSVWVGGGPTVELSRA
ncbi:MAG TPA: hypothetical protein VF786_02300, partial [Terriglobales bacterium]